MCAHQLKWTGLLPVHVELSTAFFIIVLLTCWNSSLWGEKKKALLTVVCTVHTFIHLPIYLSCMAINQQAQVGSEVESLGWGSATPLRVAFITFRLKPFVWFGVMVNWCFINYSFKTILCHFWFLSGHPVMLVSQQNLLSIGELNMMICKLIN